MTVNRFNLFPMLQFFSMLKQMRRSALDKQNLMFNLLFLNGIENFIALRFCVFILAFLTVNEEQEQFFV